MLEENIEAMLISIGKILEENIDVKDEPWWCRIELSYNNLKEALRVLNES